MSTTPVVTFSAKVKLTNGSKSVTAGTVTFIEGATVLAGPIALNSGGVVSFSKSNLSVGSHTITAVYNGTANFNASSGSVIQTVRP